MTWQKKARFAIAAFVVIFVAVVIVALRQRRPATVEDRIPQRRDPKSVAEAQQGVVANYKDKKLVYSLKFEGQATYPDGRTVQQHVTLTLPDRNGRTLVVTAKEGERLAKPGQDIGAIHLTGDAREPVKLNTSDGAVITTNDSTYDDATGLVQVPGDVGFTRGRIKGTGVGATYDRNRDVLWLLDKAHITVTPDEKGQGAMEATSASAGLARADHYVKLTRNAHITADKRVIDADEITIMLSADDKRVQMLQLRTNSRMTGEPGRGGPESMSAKDIDLTYGDDGRTLQHAQLMENGVVQLAGDGKAQGKRIAGRTIDIAMGPDGSTLTNLTATEAVQVDLPGEGDAPAKRIRSATLTATGAPGTGLQNFTFGGNVDYRESRAARGALAAVDRTARASTLIVHTKPGFGAPDEADFRGNVHITDSPQIDAYAPRVLYHVERDQMDLSPGDGDVGTGPLLTDARVTIDARTISFTLGTRKLKAETKVRGRMQPQAKEPAGRRGAAPPAAATPGSGGHIPSLLAQDKPVNVTSNHLDYDGAAGHAIYSGNARLWQDDTSVAGDTIIVDDKTGNLDARGHVKTEMTLDEVDSKTGQRTSTRSKGSGETFVYEDAKRLATYTTDAHLNGSEGDVTADRLELFLKEGANELERLEGYGKDGTVIVKESARTATGGRVTYTTKNETYLMTGRPVEIVEIAPPECKKSVGTTLTFQKSVDTTSMSADGDRVLARNIPCPAGVK